MMITGVCTVLLVLVNLIFGGQITGPGDPGSLPVVYVVLTLVFLAVAVGVCYRTVLNGLKALFSFNANSDSAAAVASVAVMIQAVSAAFFQDALTDGTLHLYAVVLSAILFANAAGQADHDSPHPLQLPVCHRPGAEVQCAPVRRPQPPP